VKAAFASVLLLLAAGAAAQGDAPVHEVQNPFEPFDRAAYEAHARTSGATPAQLEEFARAAQELGAARAGDALMRSLHPTFDAAVRLSEAGDPKAALALTQLLAGSEDPVLGGHVRYHLGRVFLDGDDPERAVEILNEYLRANINRTPLDAEAAFFYAQALAEIPMPEAALPRFHAFLRWFPDASERFRATAQQRVGELEKQQESRLHSLADRMKKLARDLKKQKTDKPVQVEQQDLIEELQELIEMYEEQERQSGGAPSGNSAPSGPATKSGLTEGEGRIGSLEKRVSLADRWGEMKDKDRKEIESAIQNGLPPQYRKMLEEYYKKLGTGAVDK
jgi:tetratricopeptide (TPR) repeat protein